VIWPPKGAYCYMPRNRRGIGSPEMVSDLFYITERRQVASSSVTWKDGVGWLKGQGF
jgi:hypothetical protein